MRKTPNLTPETQAILDLYKTWQEQTKLAPKTALTYWTRIRKLMALWESDPKFKGATLESIIGQQYSLASQSSMLTALDNFDQFYSKLVRTLPGLQLHNPDGTSMDPQKFVAQIMAHPAFSRITHHKERLPVSVLWACERIATKEWYKIGVHWVPQRGAVNATVPIPLEAVPTLLWAHFKLQPGEEKFPRGWFSCQAVSTLNGWAASWTIETMEAVQAILWAWAGVWQPGEPPPTLPIEALVLPVAPGNFTEAVSGEELRRQYQMFKSQGRQWMENFRPELDFDPMERAQLARTNQTNLAARAPNKIIH
jgi:hypothetical protein